MPFHKITSKNDLKELLEIYEDDAIFEILETKEEITLSNLLINYNNQKINNMLEKLISLLNSNDWFYGDEWVQIAKGKYALPKNIKDVKDKTIRIIKTKRV